MGRNIYPSKCTQLRVEDLFLPAIALVQKGIIAIDMFKLHFSPLPDVLAFLRGRILVTFKFAQKLK